MNDKKRELTKEEKIEELTKNLDVVYKFCQKYNDYYGTAYDTFEDFVSQCKVIAYGIIPKWNNTKAAITTFLYTVLPYKLKKIYKAKSAETDYIIFSDLEDDDEEDFESQLVGEENEPSLEFKMIENDLDIMTKEYYLEGYNYKQIGERHNCCARTVRERIKANLEDIRKNFKKK